MEKRRDIDFKFAEKIVKQLYEMDNIRIMYLMIATDKNELNKVGIYSFLEKYEQREKLLFLLEELNRNGKELPDFIILDSSNEVFFIEVKAWNGKVTLAKIDQRDSIKQLADNGFKCIIKNVTVDWHKMKTEKINSIMGEYGLIMKGKIKGEPLYSLSLLEEEKQSEPHHNVSIWNMVVRIN